VAESFFGSLKKERVYSEDYKSRREAKSDIVDYIEMFYNSFRRHSHLGNINPREFRKQWLLKKCLLLVDHSNMLNQVPIRLKKLASCWLYDYFMI
jgi:hypothetical protein